MSAPRNNSEGVPGASRDRVADAASEWVVRRDRGLTAEEQRELARWLAADPRHEAEFRRLSVTWAGLEALSGQADLELMAEQVVARARRRRTQRRVVAFGSVALAAAAALAVAFLPSRDRDSRADAPRVVAQAEAVQVVASTVRRMPLPDGSVAELNGSSRIEIEFTAAERRVRLLDGEAHFVVAKDATRPFLVAAGPLAVRAVGTAFNVRLGSAAVEVLVTEGKVQLQHTIPATPAMAAPAIPVEPPAASALVAGQRAVVATERPSRTAEPMMAIDQVDEAEIEKELGWQNTRLVLLNTPLAEVVEAFNRFNERKLVIGDPSLRARALTGVFRADNLEGFVRLLSASSDVKAEPRGEHELVLLPTR